MSSRLCYEKASVFLSVITQRSHEEQLQLYPTIILFSKIIANSYKADNEGTKNIVIEISVSNSRRLTCKAATEQIYECEKLKIN